MKKFKKVVPALCALLVSAVMLGSSTYAWFSMNTKVTATGMTVNAKSDSKFLQIVAGTAGFADDEAQISAEAVNKTKDLRPTSAVKAIGTDNLTLTELAQADKATDIKWVEAFSNDPASSTKNGEYKEVTTAAQATDASNLYTLINDFKVRLNPKAGANSAEDLSVTGVTITSTATVAKNDLLASVRVLFVCGDKWAIWSNGAKVSASSDTSVLAATVNSTTPTEIKVYIYFDGEDTATTTNNATKLSTDGYKVEFVLGVA